MGNKALRTIPQTKWGGMASPAFSGDDSPGWPTVKRNRDASGGWKNRYDNGTHNPSGGDSSSNGGSQIVNASNFWSATSSGSAMKLKIENVKYGRTWGFTIGHDSKPPSSSEHTWMHNVTGIEFDWNRSETEDGKNISRVKYMGLTYAKPGNSSLQYIPLVHAYSNVGTYSYKGSDLINLTESNGFTPSGSYSGRLTSANRNIIYNENLVFVGFHIWWHQNGNQTIGKHQVMRMWKVRPLLGEAYMGSSSLQAIISNMRYKMSDAEGSPDLLPLAKV